jgi:hypothetical protein
MHSSAFEMQRDCFKDVAAKFIPRIAFGENGVAKGARVIAAFLRVANLEDQLHTPKNTLRSNISEQTLLNPPLRYNQSE